MDKESWLHAAEAFDSWRVVPRIVLFLYCWLVGWSCWFVLTTYFSLPAIERTGQVTALVTIVIPGILGLAVWVFKIYTENGRDWNAKNGPEVR
jgi:hypothetical protein